MTEGARVMIELKRVSIDPEAPPVPVFHFMITRVGEQYLLEPGFVDLVEFKEEIDRIKSELPKQATVQLFVREKYLCTRQALTQLREAADEILSRSPGVELTGG